MNSVMYDRAMARLRSAEYLLPEISTNKEIKGLIAFDLQQAIEFLLHQICISLNANPASNHDISQHINRVINVGDSSTTVKDLSNIASIVTSWEVNGRYSAHFDVDIDVITSVLTIAKELANYVYTKYVCKPKFKVYMKLIEIAAKFNATPADISKFYQYLKTGVIVKYPEYSLVEYAIQNIDDLLSVLSEEKYV